MPGEIFKDTLRRGWRGALYWAIGMAVFGAYITFLTPDPAGLKGYVDLINLMPPALLQSIGLSDPAILATAEGFIGFAFFTYGAVVLAVYSVFAGLSVTSNDEDSGVMDMLLALPLPRWRVVVERLLAQFVLAVMVAFGGAAGILLVRSFNPAVAAVNGGMLFQACIGFVPLMLMFITVTLLLTVVIRRRQVAVAAAGGFVAVSYLLQTLGAVAGEGIGGLLKGLSLFSYYDGASIVLNGLNTANILLLTVGAVLLAAISVNRFIDRDIYR